MYIWDKNIAIICEKMNGVDKHVDKQYTYVIRNYPETFKLQGCL